MHKLLRFWSHLERRTYQTLELLRAAAEQQCGFDATRTGSDSKPSRAVRKARERRRKALTTIEDLLARSSTSEDRNALHSMFEPLAGLIESRSVMRGHWSKREHDHVFHELSSDCRPMIVPLCFNQQEGAKAVDEECGSSPMQGSSAELKQISEDLRNYGKAFQSTLLRDLPLVTIPTVDADTRSEDKEHSKCLEWCGWSQYEFGLELQEPWAAAVVEGRKPIETRTYDLPPALWGKRVMIIQSPAGKAGVSGMGNVINLSDPSTDGARVVGWITIDSVKKYTTKEGFDADEQGHLVGPASGYGWKKGKTKELYGWMVGRCGTSGAAADEFICATRRMRSLFQLQKKDGSFREDTNRATKKKSNEISAGKWQKKRRKRF